MNSSSKKIFRNGFSSKFLLIISLLCLFIFLNAFSYVSAVSTDISSSVFRLHVIANSDTDEDQALKYKVRDALLEYMNSICKDVPSKQEAMDIANSHIDDFFMLLLKRLLKKTDMIILLILHLENQIFLPKTTEMFPCLPELMML